MEMYDVDTALLKADLREKCKLTHGEPIRKYI